MKMPGKRMFVGLVLTLGNFSMITYGTIRVYLYELQHGWKALYPGYVPWPFISFYLGVVVASTGLLALAYIFATERRFHPLIRFPFSFVFLLGYLISLIIHKSF